MTVTQEKQENFLVVAVDGRIDTVTAPMLQGEILKAFQKDSAVELNLEKVDYISSAGLRVLLIGQKTAMGKGGTFQVSHAGPQVLSILEMTGMKSVLTLV